jgi:hypothetical protein
MAAFDAPALAEIITLPADLQLFIVTGKRP